MSNPDRLTAKRTEKARNGAFWRDNPSVNGTRRPLRGVSNVASLVVQLVGGLPQGPLRLIGAALLSILATGASVALMGVSAWLLARAAEQPPVLYLLVGATAVRAFGTSRGVLRYLERLLSHDVTLRMQSSLRLRVYDHLARTTLLGTRRGDLLIRVTADVEAIMDVIVRVALPFVSASVVLLGTCFVVMFLDVPTAVMLLVSSVVAGIVLPVVAQRMSARADAAAVPARSDLAQVVHASARAATDVVAYGRAEQQLAVMAAADARLRAAESRAAWTRGLAAGSQVVVMGLAVAAALWLGGQAVVAGDMLRPNLAAVALLPLALNESFADLAKAAQTMTHASAALRRVIELLTAKPVGSGDRMVGDPTMESAEPPAESDLAPGSASRSPFAVGAMGSAHFLTSAHSAESHIGASASPPRGDPLCQTCPEATSNPQLSVLGSSPGAFTVEMFPCFGPKHGNISTVNVIGDGWLVQCRRCGRSFRLVSFLHGIPRVFPDAVAVQQVLEDKVWRVHAIRHIQFSHPGQIRWWTRVRRERRTESVHPSRARPLHRPGARLLRVGTPVRPGYTGDHPGRPRHRSGATARRNRTHTAAARWSRGHTVLVRHPGPARHGSVDSLRHPRRQLLGRASGRLLAGGAACLA